MNTLPKYVASRTLTNAEWNATILTGEVPEAVAKLKERRGQNLLLYGSSALLNTLLEHDLIDHYRLMIYPVVLGQGKRLFGDSSEEKPLRLVDVSTTSTGVMMGLRAGTDLALIGTEAGRPSNRSTR